MDPPVGEVDADAVDVADALVREGGLEPGERARDLDHAETLTLALLEAGRGEAAWIANTLASVHLFGWYGLEKNLEKGAGLLDAVENVLPEDPLMQLLKAKLLIYRTDYPAAFTYAEKAEKGLQTAAETDETAAEDLHRAKTAKISASTMPGAP